MNRAARLALSSARARLGYKRAELEHFDARLVYVHEQLVSMFMSLLASLFVNMIIYNVRELIFIKFLFSLYIFK